MNLLIVLIRHRFKKLEVTESCCVNLLYFSEGFKTLTNFSDSLTYVWMCPRCYRNILERFSKKKVEKIEKKFMFAKKNRRFRENSSKKMANSPGIDVFCLFFELEIFIFFPTFFLLKHSIIIKSLRLSEFYELGKNTKGNHRSTKERALSQASSGSSFVLTLVLFLKDFDYHILS